MSPLQIAAVVLLSIILVPLSLVITFAVMFGEDKEDKYDVSHLLRGNRTLDRSRWRSSFDDGYDIFCD